jgi:4'-phosphopantetheinyl transferase EntD
MTQACDDVILAAGKARSAAEWARRIGGLFDIDVSAAAFVVQGNPGFQQTHQRNEADHRILARRREFRSGRVCAQRALAARGRIGEVVRRNVDRSPGWPSGIVGSVSHCAGIAAAVVTEEDKSASLGLDVERWTALPIEVAELVRCREDVQANVTHPDMLIFSAKEALYKCYYPVVRRFLGFLDVAVRFSEIALGHGCFEARLLNPACPGEDVVSAMEARWFVDADRVVTAAWLPPALNARL